MDIIYGLLVVLHIIVSFLIIIAILLQPGRYGGGIGVLGGGSSTSVFGGRGATTILSKATGVLAAIFMILSVLIAITRSGEKSVVDQHVSSPPPVESTTNPEKPTE